MSDTARLPGVPLPGAGTAGAYTDMAGLGRLRAAAGQQSPEALAAVAQQFEALFLGMMLDSMRDASGGEGLFDNSETELYQQLLDRQFALEASRGKGLGIARAIIEQLGHRQAAESAAPATAPAVMAPATIPPAAVPLAPRAADEFGPWPEQAERPATALLQAPATTAGVAPFQPATPLGFIRELLPHAQRAAAELGVHPAALLAQAALETGWGSRLPRTGDGGSSHNLFGIKAGAQWAGGRASATTVEFEHGVAVRRSESFRAYGSVAEAFDDYVDLIRQSPRYAEALAAGSDPRRYAAGLQAAGYATDPRYADKIAAIVAGPTLAAAIGGGPTSDARGAVDRS